MLLHKSSKSQRAQSAVELALILPVAMIVVAVAAQFAVIGRDALALQQITYQAARWATSKNPSAQCPDVTTYIANNASQSIQAIITESGIGCSSGKGVNVTMSCPLDANACKASTRPIGTQLEIATTMDVSSHIFMWNPFLGIVKFPTTLSSAQIATN